MNDLVDMIKCVVSGENGSSDFPSNQSFGGHALPLSKATSSSFAEVFPGPTA